MRKVGKMQAITSREAPLRATEFFETIIGSGTMRAAAIWVTWQIAWLPNAIGQTPEKVPAQVSTEVADAGDWPGFLGPQRNGKSTERGLPTNWPSTGPPVVWQQPIGTGYAAPAISYGRLFHFARFADTARLTCFNAETGAELWRCEHPTDYEDLLGYNNGPRATPVVEDDRVFT